jgi:hypothetical protein
MAPFADAVTVVHPRKYILFGARSVLVRAGCDFFDNLVDTHATVEVECGVLLATPGTIVGRNKARAIGRALETPHLPNWLELEGWALLKPSDCAMLCSALEATRSDIRDRPELVEELDNVSRLLSGCGPDERVLVAFR